MNLGLNLMQGPDGGGSFIPGTVPKVMSSQIPAKGNGVGVVFDRPMVTTAHVQDALSVIINGGTPVKPDRVEKTPDGTSIALIYPDGFFKPGDVVTWSYNDQHPTEEIKGAETGGKEIDNQTYGVANHATVPTLSVVSSTIYDNNHKRILVKMNEAMKTATADARFQIAIAINGAAPIIPKAVLVANDFLTFSDTFNAGETITWQYSTGAEKIESLAGEELDTLVHTVVNNIVVPVNNDWVDETGKPWTDGTDHWTYK